MKVKYMCTISYDGTNFSGFQIQPNKRTVHGEIEKALNKMHKGTHIAIHASGRTDAGVHAIGQTIMFESELQIPLPNWKRALNTLLPNDIYVCAIEHVPSSFHVRFDAKEKEYRYFILNEKQTDIFRRNYVYQYPYLLNIELMQEACTYLEGTHDFTTFASAKASVKGSRVRTLSKVVCMKDDNEVYFIIRGNGFLYKMVRIIIGVLLDIGKGKIPPIEIEQLLQKKDRRLVGETVPPQGLYLWEVTY